MNKDNCAADGAVGQTQAKTIVSFLDRASDITFCLPVIAAAILLDVFLKVTNDTGMLTTNGTSTLTSMSLEAWVCLVGAYTLTLAALSPFLQYVADQIVLLIRYSKLGCLLSSARDVRCPNSLKYVSLPVLEETALARNDEFMLRAVDKHRSAAQRSRRSLRTAASLSFACVALLVADWIAGASLVQALLNPQAFIGTTVGQLGLSGAWLSVALVAAPWWLHAWVGPSDSMWVFYPPLAEELERQRQHALGGPDYLRRNAPAI